MTETKRKSYALFAITKHGIEIAKQLKNSLEDCDLFVSRKLFDSGSHVFFVWNMHQYQTSFLVQASPVISFFGCSTSGLYTSPVIFSQFLVVTASPNGT